MSRSIHPTVALVLCRQEGRTSLRLVHSLEPLNGVTIQHLGVPPFTDLFSGTVLRRAFAADSRPVRRIR